MTPTNPQNRFRVICDLTAQEYEEQQRLALANPHRHHPIIEFISLVPPHHRISEDHIGRIAADAWTAVANGTEMNYQDQHAIERTGLSWPMEKKINFLCAASEHWTAPSQDEASHWNQDSCSAMEFLYLFPEVHQQINN